MPRPDPILRSRCGRPRPRPGCRKQDPALRCGADAKQLTLASAPGKPTIACRSTRKDTLSPMEDFLTCGSGDFADDNDEQFVSETASPAHDLGDQRDRRRRHQRRMTEGTGLGGRQDRGLRFRRQQSRCRRLRPMRTGTPRRRADQRRRRTCMASTGSFRRSARRAPATGMPGQRRA